MSGRENENHHRPIRSFVRREGRLTPGQKQALQRLWSRFGIDSGDQLLDFRQEFDHDAPVWLEIGFGNGEALLEMAAAQTRRNWLGIEVHRPGVGRLLRELETRNIENVRVLKDDAADVLLRRIPDRSLAGVCLFFPDPWPKKRHHKRRLLQPAFLALVGDKLQEHGLFHFATDWQEYAEFALQIADNCAAFENLAGAGAFSPRPESRPLTRFEERGRRLGHGVWDLRLRKRSR